VNKTPYIHLLCGLDVAPLAFALARQPELWNRHPERLSTLGPHAQTDDIFLRYKDDRPNWKTDDWSDFSQPHDAIWYPAWYALPEAKPLVFELMHRFCGERLGGVFIYRVPAWHRIAPHVDTGWHPEFFDKFNVCIASNPKAEFKYKDDGFHQQAGDCHWFINTVEHSVVNDGDTDHLIMTVCMQLDHAAYLDKGFSLEDSPVFKDHVPAPPSPQVSRETLRRKAVDNKGNI
jgi:hypothetical protein